MNKMNKVRNFDEYLEGDPYRWFFTKIFETTESWDDMKERILERFRVPIANSFRAFMYCQQKKGQVVQKYYHSKRWLGSLCGLKYDNIIYGFTGGFLPEIELALANLTVSIPSRWHTVAKRVQTFLERTGAASAWFQGVAHILVVLPSATDLHLQSHFI